MQFSTKTSQWGRTQHVHGIENEQSWQLTNMQACNSINNPARSTQRGRWPPEVSLHRITHHPIPYAPPPSSTHTKTLLTAAGSPATP